MITPVVVEPNNAAAAADAILRDGFVVLGDVLDADALARARSGVDRVVAEQTAAVSGDEANRGFNRYSFGDQLHHPEWAALVDVAPVLAVLERLWASDDFTCSAAGGDYSLPGAGWQHLHSDVGEFLHDPLGVVTTRDLPPPYIVANYPMVDFDEANGATRLIPGTQRSRAPIPGLDDEPEWMRQSQVRARAGSVIVRDVRCWHGGTPNRSDRVRAMVGVAYFAPWYRPRKAPVIPEGLFRSLSPRARRLCDSLAASVSGYG